MQDRLTYRYHRVRSVDTLEGIAKRHHTDPELIVSFHEATPEQLLDFDELVVPVPLDRARSEIVSPDPELVRGRRYGPQPGVRRRHRVVAGDSLWKIAQRYGVTVSQLRRWNGIGASNHLSLGQKLDIFSGKRPAQRSAPTERRPKKRPQFHVVRAGESLWLIARRYGLSVAELRLENGLAPGSLLSIGRRLRLPAK